MVIYVRDENGVLQTLKIPAYKGERGEAGITPNIQIGDVITLESGQQATVVRRGDDENPIFDFAIPKGEDGKDGIFVGNIDDAPEHAQIVINDDPSPYDLFYENANVSYMGDTYTSLKEKADADIEYLLRKFATQHYEGTNITATDTYAKQVKDAMFKGQTLVNMIAKSRLSNSVLEGTSTSLTDNKTMIINEFTYEPSSGKKYLLFLDIFENTSSRITLSWRGKNLKHLGNTNMPNLTGVTGKHYFVVTVPTLNDSIESFSIKNENGDGVITINHRFMFVEYQDGMENQDIPYFKGMASVKAPTVKTVGKNLLNPKTMELIYSSTNNPKSFTYDEVTDTYEFLCPTSVNQIAIHIKNLYGVTKLYEQIYFSGTYESEGKTYSTSNATKRLDFIDGVIRISLIFNWKPITKANLKIMITSDDNANKTTYEPYTSSSLTPPEEVVLRSLPNGVCDTFDTGTGEYVKRVGETVLNGNEDDWVSIRAFEMTNVFRRPFPLAKPGAEDYGTTAENFITDRLPVVRYDTYSVENAQTVSFSSIKSGAYNDTTAIYINKNSSSDLPAFKAWLQANPVTIQYELATPIVTTVDLQNQKIYSYDGTTYYTTASAQGHPAPILSIDVPTNTTKMIARQREEIEHQEQKLQEQEEVQNVLIESQLAWYEQTLLLDDNQEIPSHIQKLYEVAYKRGIRIKEGEI